MSVLSLFATCPRAMEDLLSAELGEFGAAAIHEAPSGASFSATLETAYRCCLWSRIANRVLLRIASFEAASPDELRERIQALPWGDHLDAHSTFAVDATLSGAGDSVPKALANARYVALVAKDGIADSFRAAAGRRPDVRPDQPDVRVNVHLHRTTATVAIDLSGESLHRRAYRASAVEAPLKENVAAGLLLRARWPEIARAGGALVDPMCGSGTLIIEGAMIAADRAPGLGREYWGFLRWKGHDERAWKRLRGEALERSEAGRADLPPVLGFDRDARAVATARANIAAAGFRDQITVARADVGELQPPDRAGGGSSTGLVAVNPPWGERMGGSPDALRPLYAEIGRLLHERFRGWSAAVLTAHETLAKGIGLRAARVNTLYNGPIRCTLAIVELTPGNRYVPLAAEEGRLDSRDARAEGRPERRGERAAGPSESAGRETEREAEHEARERHPESARDEKTARPSWERASTRDGASARPEERGRVRPAGDANIEMFVNRIEKNRRHLAKWARRENVTCYRIYDADLPEYAVAIDLYEGRWLHVQEYVAPAYIDPDKSERRLEAIMDSLPGATEIAPENVFLKKRRKRKRTEQYERLDTTGRFYQIHEGGYGFLANFTDYLDTGIFLDHRITRSLIRDAAKGRHVLNLYAYTATASVYAAKGGALSTTSVDSSNTYLKWARENFTLNGIAGQEHRLERADCTEWLREDRRRYGVIFMDPPTYSNSKDRRPTLDVQRDHVKLIELAASRLEPDGALFFSTNFRRFQLDRSALGAFEIDDISKLTIPPDFERNPRIHRCFRIRHR